MTPERYNELMDALFNNDNEVELTEAELAQGWHWCYDFDGLLVGPDTGEAQYCTCNPLCNPNISEDSQDSVSIS